MHLPHFDAIDAPRLEWLRTHLAHLGFTEAPIAERLRVRHVSSMALAQYPVYEARLERFQDPLSTLISLFLMQAEVPRGAAEEALTPGFVGELEAAGMLAGAPEAEAPVHARVDLYPCAGCWFFTDHRFWPVSHAYDYHPPQPVMYLGEDSYALAYLAPEPGEAWRVLDLCTGSGVQAVLAGRTAASVTGVDVNPRAVAFATFNARFNGVERSTAFRLGSLYAPVDEGGDAARFDLVLANPPFVPSPHSGEGRLLYRDGGPAGDEILREIVAGLGTHAAPGGRAAIISIFSDQAGAPLDAKLAAWLGDGAGEMLLLRFFGTTPEEYASWHTGMAFGDSYPAFRERFREWLAALCSAQVEWLVSGVLAIRLERGASGFRAIDLAVPTGPAREVLSRELFRDDG